MDPLYLTKYTAVTALGKGLEAQLLALREGRSGLHPSSFENIDLDMCIGCNTCNTCNTPVRQGSNKTYDMGVDTCHVGLLQGAGLGPSSGGPGLFAMVPAKGYRLS